jgi:DMSO/TMAO reductase YedYZ molybdopterin-dependent catalytic subunit
MTGVLVGMLVLSAVAGLLARKGTWRGQLVFGALALIAAVATLSRPGGGVGGLIPVLLGGATWLVLLGFLTSALDAAQGDPVPASEDRLATSRRLFLTRIAAVGGGAVAVAIGGRFLGRHRREVEAARSKLKLPVTAGAEPEGAELGVKGVVPWRVPNQDFYQIHTAVAVPAIEAREWRVRIHGQVERELTFSYQDLLDRGLTEAWVTLCCVSNVVGGSLIGNAWWSGVRVADLLAEARPKAGADAVMQTSQDGWTCGTPLSALTDGRNAMLALGMNGQPLPLEHGFPVRMVVPGLYGYVSACKWLVDLEVTRFADFSAYWTERGWSAKGPVRTESRIDVPPSQTGVSAGDVRVAGVAWAQHTGIDKVEISLDGGPWTETELGGVPSDDTWVQWAGTVQADPGSHGVAVRATDKSGYTQTAVQRDVVPNGATGWHTVYFTAE